ncbi:hypothetical protein BUALT_Bualt14G0132800 [Buddleja alternifolia]|uniref:MATH domain-containing protein n=1 Tax=Buddleja alternifolia TaxID=168488 RepID=A0AAV6WIL3_9LAMI|nr:hypothetical protein BUALT_Bualt14G0132800 [Buddleja alternifolia]
MATNLSSPHQNGVFRSISDTPPNHYSLKIELFSQLTKNKIERYTSTDFQAGGYKWKLVVHPDGNKDKGITDHISLYLVLVPGASSNSPLPPGWEIRALFRLYLLDQNNDTYLTLQDTAEKGRRFHGMKQEWGFDKFIPHTTFKDADNGYLVNDTCVFGAEVYVCQEKHTGKGECLSMIKDAITYKNTWRIENFNSLNQECVDSIPFNAADHKWKMQVYPKGKANYWFSASNTTCGWPRFVSHAYFNLSTVGLLVKNVCLVEAEVIVHGVAAADAI